MLSYFTLFSLNHYMNLLHFNHVFSHLFHNFTIVFILVTYFHMFSHIFLSIYEMFLLYMLIMLWIFQKFKYLKLYMHTRNLKFNDFRCEILLVTIDDQDSQYSLDSWNSKSYLKLHMHTSNLEYYDRHRIREILLVTTEYQDSTIFIGFLKL